MPATIGLYHPYIHFRDDAWLKRSALYWDKMARIVPPIYQRGRYTPELKADSTVTRELIDELDYIVNVSPNAVTYPLVSLFTNLLVRYAAQLREHYGVSRSADWPADPVTALHAQLRDPALAYVHLTKIDRHLAEQLQDAGLAVQHDRTWFGMHPRLASVYMAALAEEISAVNGFSPTTAEPVDHVAALGWGLDRLAAALLGEHHILDTVQTQGIAAGATTERGVVDPEASAMLALMAISVPLPADAAAVPVAKIADFRRRYRPELRRFQEFTRTFAEEQLGDLDLFRADPAAVHAHLKAGYEDQIAPMVNDLRRALRGVGIDTVEAALGTSIVVPAALQPLNAPEPVTLGAAAVVSLLPVLRAKRRIGHAAYDRSPVAYLLRLDEELTPQTMSARIGRCVRRFVVGV